MPSSAEHDDAGNDADREPLADLPAGYPISRRGFMQGLAAIAAGLCSHVQGAPRMPSDGTAMPAPLADAGPVTLNVNGRQHQLKLEPGVTLLDALREHLQLTGTKKGCDRGQCGACTVLVNGRRINACLTLAVMHEGDEITTVEGLAHLGRLNAMQAAFIEHDAFQCGYCTPGQLCSAVALLSEAAAGEASALTPDLGELHPVALGDDEIRERMSGNLCRCGAYQNIVAAIRMVNARTG